MEINVWEQLRQNLIEYWQIIVISLPKLIISIVILCFFVLIAGAVGRIFRRKMRFKPADSITAAFIIRITRFLLITVGVILAFHALGFEDIAGGLLAGAGVGAIIIGFAFKEIGENFLAGIILVFDRPFNIGDTVSIDDKMGIIMGLKFRTTHIKSFDGKDIYVPNGSVIRNDVINHTRDGLLRHEFIIGVDYNDNIAKAGQLILDVLRSHPSVLKNEGNEVVIDEFAVNTINLKVMFWIDTLDFKTAAYVIKSEVMEKVKDVLQENNFGLPANIQEIKLYRPEPLQVQFNTKKE